MPLADQLPVLDNRRFADLVAEARARIPSYTPEWTDLNDNEPGMALVQLFAWMTDLLFYRLGRVPELNYLTFLELLGIELEPATAASVELTFAVKAGNAAAVVNVPLHLQVAATAQDGSRVIFETDRSLSAVRANLVALQSRSGAVFRLLTQANQDMTTSWAPFGPTPAIDDSLLLGFDEALPAAAELSLFVWPADADEAPAPFPCGGSASTPAPATIAWEYWSGTSWQALTVLVDDSRAFTRPGAVRLRAPAANTMNAVQIGQETQARYWLRARLTRVGYQVAPLLAALRTNTVSALQAETVTDEVLGGSDGTPNQELTLRFSPVLDGTLELQVDEGTLDETGAGFVTWTPVVDFHGAAPDDRVYVLDRASGVVRFGDGVHGKIPVANADLPSGNVVARTYRHGGGSNGNVAAGAASSPLMAVQGIDTVSNPRAAIGGRDEETLADAKARAALSVRSNGRAVTAQDFEQHAEEAPNVARAKALPLFHPQFPDVPIPGVVTVIVVPSGPGPRPMPTADTLAAVCAVLDSCRLLTTEVFVTAPAYVQVEADVSVIALDTADTGEVQQAVEQALLAYFHPLTGGDDGTGWPFGRTIFYSPVYQRVLQVDGVSRIDSLVLRVNGREQQECTNVPIASEALVYSTSHQVDVSYDYSG